MNIINKIGVVAFLFLIVLNSMLSAIGGVLEGAELQLLALNLGVSIVAALAIFHNEYR